MIDGVADRSFGNAGTIWSAIPTPFTPQSNFRESFPAFVGGTAIGVHRLGAQLALVVEGWAQQKPGGPWLTSALAIVPPAGGVPFEVNSEGGTLVYPLAASGVTAEPVASCDGAGGTMTVLVRVMTSQAGRSWWDYGLRTVGTTGPLDESPVKHAWLFDPVAIPPSGNVRILDVGSAVAIASTQWEQLRVTFAPRAGQALTVTIPLGKKVLPGLVRMTVASLRLWGSELSIALTAVVRDKTLGEVSHGALVKLQLGSKIALDTHFGKGGVWLSPRFADGRDFVCGGWTSRGLAGVAGSAAVAFAVDANGHGLDHSFGSNGVCEVDLGGDLSSPVATSDRNEWIYVFAQRMSDRRTVGCRIRVRSGLLPVPNGTVDPAFGTNGVATLHLDGAPATPAALALEDFSLSVAVTRGIRGSDCDRVPTVVVLQPLDGSPDDTFGAGGFALHGSLGRPAAFAADGSCLFSAPALSSRISIQLIGADGGAVRTIEPQFGVVGVEVQSMRRLADGSTLLSGADAAGGFIAKLTPAGAPDPNFGSGGVATPFAETDTVSIVGVRADGRVVVRGLHNDWPTVALLHPDGSADSSYGTSGFVNLWGGADVRVFAQDDDSLLCVCSLARTRPDPDMLNGTPNVQPVKLGLQRILADGSYDGAFGWGPPMVFPPNANTLVLGGAGSGVDDGFDSAIPAGIAALGGKYYLVATGFVGGRVVSDGRGGTEKLPVLPVLVITRWNSDGSLDRTFATQIGGFAPDRLYWTAVGVLAESASSVLAYGMAARRTTAPGTIADLLPAIRQPQPALFRVAHPGGIDFTFGHGGAATMAMQEFGPAAAVAGVQLANGKVRLAMVDILQRTYGIGFPQHVVRLDSSFGGLAQFR